MRVDKYLWAVRVYKSRSLATEAAKKNRISVNGELAKPSKELSIGDMVEVKKQGITYRYEVLQFPKSRIGAKLKTLYVKDKTPKEEIEKLKSIRETQSYYRYKGVGRPTKKDRRDLDDFMDEEEYDE